jgi:hypothetical protein
VVAAESEESQTGIVESRQKKILVEMSVSMSGEQDPIFTVKTNLPDGTKVGANLLTPVPDCYGNCFMLGRLDYIVKNGEFIFKPYQSGTIWPRPDGKDGLHPGRWVLEVFTLTDTNWQSDPEVRRILGEHGENIYGPLIDQCCFDKSRYKTDFDLLKEKNTLRELRKMLNEKEVYFGMYVYIN